MIEELDWLQKQADLFESGKNPEDILTIAIINVGYTLTSLYPTHVAICEAKLPKNYKSNDNSKYQRDYPLTHLGQPIGLPEYATRIT